MTASRASATGSMPDSPVRERAARITRSFGADPDAAAYAMRVSLTAGLTMVMAFLVDLPNTYWALLTLPLVITPQAGTTIWRSTARVGGTLVGALVAVVLSGLFAQSGMVMVLAMALWIVGCGYLARGATGFDGYAYGTAGLTVLVIGIDTGPNLDQLFGYALYRSTETIIPVIAGLIVMLSILPRSVEGELLSSLGTARSAVLDLVLRQVEGRDLPTEADLVDGASRIDGLFTTIRARRLERANDGSGAGRVETATAGIVHLYHHGAALEAADRAAGDRAEDTADDRALLARLMAAADEDEDPARQADALRALAEDLRPEVPPADAPPEILAAALRRHRLSRLADAAADEAETYAAAIGARPPLPPRRFSSRYFDHSAAVQRGLRPAIAFTLICIVWFATAWTNGGIFALITGALSLLIPTILPRAMLIPGGKKIGLGFLCGGVLALVASAAFPVMEGITGFLAVFMPLVFTIFYVARGPNVPIALGTTIMFAVAFAPSNDQSYDPLRALNIVVTLAMMPVAFVITQAVFFPENAAFLRRHLDRARRRFMAPAGRWRDADSLAAEAIDVIADYGGDLDMERQGDARLVARTRAAARAGIEMLTLGDYARTSSPAVRDRLGTLARRLPQGGQGAMDALDTLRRAVHGQKGWTDYDAAFALIGLRSLLAAPPAGDADA